MLREKSCGVVVFCDNEYLLLHYPSRHWDFPKGHVEKGEKEEETAIREAKEETGLDVRILPGFREKISYFYKKEGLVGKDVIFFLAEAENKEVKLSAEHQGFKWLPFEEAKKQLTFENARKVLEKANEFLRNAKL